jgi:hypothetical protein
MTYSNLGAAEKDAQANANRDRCKWYICHASPHDNRLIIADEFTKNDYPATCPVIRWVSPQKTKSNPKSIFLTDEEIKLVAAVLSPDEPGRDFYPGSEETKQSLLSKLLRKKE